MHNSSESSTILLVILGNDAKPEQLDKLTLSLIQKLFEPFGVLRKIIIFLREGVVKAFIEYETTQESSYARSSAHDCLFNHFGKVKIFFSALQKLDLVGRQVETKDFQIPKVAPPLIPIAVKISKNMSLKTPIVLSRMQKAPETIAKKGLTEIVNFNNKLIIDKENISSQNQMPVKIPKTSFPLKEIRTVLNPEAETDHVVDSKVVLISNIDDFFVDVAQIFNVFSCFGNISKILFMKNLKKALVEFKKHESGELAVNGINNCTFGKTKIKVAFSKFRQIDLKRNNKSEKSQSFNEVMVVANPMNRFKNNLPEDVVLPTDTLRAVIAKGDSVLLSDLILGVQLSAKALKTKTVEAEEDGQEQPNHEVLFRFANVQEAVRVLAQSHNNLINGHALNLGFADDRI